MKFKYLLIICSLGGFFLQSCKDNSTNPSTSNHNMSEVGKYDTPGYAEGVSVAVISPYTACFVADGPAGMEILNMNIPTAPALISSISSTGNAINVTTGQINSDYYAFLSCDNQGLDIIKVTSLTNPVIDTTLNFPNNRVLCSYVDVPNKNLYIGTYNGILYIYSLSNFPGQISFLGLYQNYGNVPINNITWNENLAYLAEGSIGLEIVNVVNPSVPVFLSGFPSNGLFFNDVKIKGHYAYIAAGDRLINLDITNPFSPQFVSSYSNGNAGYYSLTVNSSNVYAAEGSSGTEILSYATQNTPLQLGYYNTNDLALGIFFHTSTGNIYIADGSDGIIILRYSN
jgi:hypothetical protein